MKKHLIIIFIIVLIITSSIIGGIVFKNDNPYASETIVGRTILSIKEEYGQFDKVFYDESGNNISSVWYIIEEKKRKLIGWEDEKYLVILFENGIATGTYERIGNIGG